MTAKVTVYPSSVEARVANGPLMVELLNAGREAGLGRMFARLLDEGVDTMELREESTDD